jgi:uncharacterized repeat protein (TIGR04138 family)
LQKIKLSTSIFRCTIRSWKDDKMSDPTELQSAVNRIRARDRRYAEDLYLFIIAGLDYTYRRQGEIRHVCGGELVRGLCSFAKEQFGVMAFTILEQWGIRSTADFGAAVYQLIDEGILSKQENDELSDFDNVLDLRNILETHYFD